MYVYVLYVGMTVIGLSRVNLGEKRLPISFASPMLIDN